MRMLSAAARRNHQMRLVSGLAIAGTATAMLTGCSAFKEQICQDGEYPVHAVGSTGRACEPDGKEPSQGYVRYPEGKVPETTDDEWDIYWRTHTIDENGNITEAPTPG